MRRWSASQITAKRLTSTSSVRSKPRRGKNKAISLQPLDLPPVPAEPPTPISSRLQERLKKSLEKVPTAVKRSHEKSENNPFDRINSIVTGWGEDKLAPQASVPLGETPLPEKHSGLAQEFEYEAFYRHGSNPPHFDRRVHTWVTFPKTLNTLETIQTGEPQPPVPRLAHSLDRVLFNSGPHWLRDPRSGFYNFDQELEKIPDIYEFDFRRLLPYVTSSRDETLAGLARREGKKFAGSTSSLTSLLSHIYFVLANGRQPDTSVLSSAFTKESPAFTYGAHWPGGIVLRHHDGVYCIDSDSMEEPEKHLLLNMGTMLEKFITHSPSEFNHLKRDSPITKELEDMKRPESYRYAKSEKFVMRSQLDAQDPRLPGTGVFDIKTRAAVAIRYDPLNYKNNSGYLIHKNHGLFESFEREQYDLMRSAFLKYLFQARIGDMDGIFVAYHNTAVMFGFEYFSRDFMDERLFGGRIQGDRVFDRCVKCMEEIVSEIALCFPGISVKCSFETSEEDGALRIYVEPDEWDVSAQGEAPIVQLLVTSTNYLNGIRIVDAMEFGTHEDDWGTLLNITRSRSTMPNMTEAIRADKEGLVERKNAFAFWLPQGVTATEMAERWVKIDYTGKALSDTQNGAEGIIDQTPAASPEELSQLILKFQHRQRPSNFVSALRKMAQKGRNRLERGDSAEVAKEHDAAVSGIPADSLDAEDTLLSHTQHSESSQENESVFSTSDSSDSGGEEGTPSSLEVSGAGVPVDDISVQVADAVDLPCHAAKEGIPNSTDMSFGEIPAINDNLTPSEGSFIGDVDHEESLGLETPEVDQVIDLLDPTNSSTSHTLSEAVSERHSVEVAKDELEAHDQAWSTAGSKGLHEGSDFKSSEQDKSTDR